MESRPRVLSDPATKGLTGPEKQQRRRSVDADFYKQPYRSPPQQLAPQEIRQQRLAGRYHELRVIDEDARPPRKDFDYAGVMNLIGIAILIFVLLKLYR